MLHGLAGRCTIWLGKNDVECDRHNLHLVKPSEQLGEHGSWQGPLPICTYTFLVDIDNYNGANGGVSRADVLITIEGTEPKLLQRMGIPDADGEKDCQKKKAETPPGSRRARQPQEQAFHRDGNSGSSDAAIATIIVDPSRLKLE